MAMYSYQKNGTTGENLDHSSEPLAYTVTDLQKALRIGRVTAYQLVNREGFPTLRLGKRILIPVAELKEWLAKNNTMAEVRGGK